MGAQKLEFRIAHSKGLVEQARVFAMRSNHVKRIEDEADEFLPKMIAGIL